MDQRRYLQLIERTDARCRSRRDRIAGAALIFDGDPELVKRLRCLLKEATR
jgi:hypothetical protein